MVLVTSFLVGFLWVEQLRRFFLVDLAPFGRRHWAAEEFSQGKFSSQLQQMKEQIRALSTFIR